MTTFGNRSTNNNMKKYFFDWDSNFDKTVIFGLSKVRIINYVKLMFVNTIKATNNNALKKFITQAFITSPFVTSLL